MQRIRPPVRTAPYVAVAGTVLVLLSIAAKATEAQDGDRGPGLLVATEQETVRDHGARDRRTAVITTADGPVQGVERNGLRMFLGIPYAAPPVGNLRWRPPQPPTRWRRSLDVVVFGNTCAQNRTLAGFAAPSEHEDCLFLNVFTPSVSRGGERGERGEHRRDRGRGHQQRPVMVWIHGGGLFDGESDDYDPSRLVTDGDVVFVSMNYRLNVFGFFSHPAINAEGHVSGNYGFMDQQLALKWVRTNIAAFGGDPQNVTIFGESSGGQSVWAHIASPTAAGLFHRAIVESSSPGNVPTLTSMEPVGQAQATAVGCADQAPACLRSVSAHDLLAANTTNPYVNPGSTAGGVFGKFNVGAMVDGTLLSQPINRAIFTGAFNRVPLISGANRDERTWFVALAELTTGHPLTADEYPDAVTGLFGALASQVMTLYPLSDYPTPSNALAAAAGDRGTICSARRGNQWVSRYVARTFAYEFEVPDAPVSSPPVSFPYRSYHTAELQFLFPLFHGATGSIHALNRPQQRLSTQMVSYWTTFARTGTPNATTASVSPPYWPRYDEARDNYQLLRTPSAVTIAPFGDRHNCAFWDSIDGAPPVTP